MARGEEILEDIGRVLQNKKKGNDSKRWQQQSGAKTQTTKTRTTTTTTMKKKKKRTPTKIRPGRVLVMCQDDSTCRELRSFLCDGPDIVLKTAFLRFVENVKEREERLLNTSGGGGGGFRGRGGRGRGYRGGGGGGGGGGGDGYGRSVGMSKAELALLGAEDAKVRGEVLRLYSERARPFKAYGGGSSDGFAQGLIELSSDSDGANDGGVAAPVRPRQTRPRCRRHHQEEEGSVKPPQPVPQKKKAVALKKKAEGKTAKSKKRQKRKGAGDDDFEDNDSDFDDGKLNGDDDDDGDVEFIGAIGGIAAADDPLLSGSPQKAPSYRYVAELMPQPHVVMHSYPQANERVCILQELRPDYVVMVDPDPAFVRNLERYQAGLALDDDAAERAFMQGGAAAAARRQQQH